MAPALLGATTFALLTALMWGLSPVIGKMGLERGGTSVQAAMTIIVTTSVLAWAALIATQGTALFTQMDAVGIGIFVVGGLIGTTIGRLAYYGGVRRVGASVSVGVMHTRPLFSVLLAVGFLSETIALRNGFGVVLIVVGVLILSLSRGGDLRGWELSDLVFPVGAALAFGAGNVIRRLGFLATSATTLEGVAINETAAILTLGGYLLAFRREEIFEADPAAIRFFVLSGTVSGIGLIAFFQAVSIGQISIVDPLSGMAPLFGALFTYLLLKDVERVTTGVILGGLLVVVGGGLATL